MSNDFCFKCKQLYTAEEYNSTVEWYTVAIENCHIDCLKHAHSIDNNRSLHDYSGLIHDFYFFTFGDYLESRECLEYLLSNNFTISKRFMMQCIYNNCKHIFDLFIEKKYYNTNTNIKFVHFPGGTYIHEYNFDEYEYLIHDCLDHCMKHNDSNHYYINNSDIYAKAAFYGKTNILAKLHNFNINSLKWNETLYEYALMAEYDGYKECVKYAYDNGCKYFEKDLPQILEIISELTI
jgi:hypothetical protein